MGTGGEPSDGYLRRLLACLEEIETETDRTARDEKIAPLVRTIHQTIESGRGRGHGRPRRAEKES